MRPLHRHPFKLTTGHLSFLVMSFLLATFLHAVETRAVSTKFLKESPSTGFDEGEMSNTSLTATVIKLSPKVTRIEGIKEQYVWCLTKDEYGNLYIGTGDPGSVYKVSPTGNFFLLYTFQEPYVQSLAVSPAGDIFVGTAPQGIIYKITPWRDVVMVCDLPDSYVWKLRFDKTGRLYAATGPEGKIYTIADDGEASVFFDSSQSHILDMIVDGEDNLYACSEPDGLVYKITPGGKAFVVYDAQEGEVHCLALDGKGNLYAGTASGARPQLPMLRQPPAAPSIGPLRPIEPVPPVEVDALQQAPLPTPQPLQIPRARPGYRPPPYPATPKAKNVVYKITPGGVIKRIPLRKPGFIFALSADPDNNVYVATGDKAGLYRIDKDENVSTLLEVEESQILSLLFLNKKGLFLGTGNKGSLYQLSRTYAGKGFFVSSAFDAKINSSWGNVSWDVEVPEGTNLTIATRTGNSKKPDNTWSEWSAELAAQAKTQSPSSRFIQYRASLSTTLPNATPTLKSVSIAYLPTNQPPEIISLSVDSHAVRKAARARMYGPRQRPDKPPGLRRPAPGPSQRRPSDMAKPPGGGSKLIKWQASDPNYDNLSFTLYHKGVRERNWKLLEEKTTKSSFVWQTTRVPDGEYLVKLVATDNPDNPPEVSLTAEKTTQPFIIDNTRPQVSSLSASYAGDNNVAVTGSFTDDLSDISRLEYSVDAADWVVIFPEDKIFDESEEFFHFIVEGLTFGEHTVVINATDKEGNIGSGKVSVDLWD
ncbi:MAG: hypothetical protein NOU37_07515 [Candidatus Brocadiales bacterium]|nr:hypothetical protein [Candidatus Bathyanammoxibius amoris]